MKHLALILEALSPLAIRSDHAAAGAGSTGYIAGSALAGSLASAHRCFYPEDDTQFQRFFLSGQVRYPDLYPAAFKSKTIDAKQWQPVFPLPKTAQTCKRFPGFRPIGDESPSEDGHGARDTLLDWAMFALLKQNLPSTKDEASAQAALLALLEPLKQCHCGQPMNHFSGYYRQVGTQMSLANLETRLQTHTGINRETGAVQEGILYHRRVFEEQARFWGQISAADDLADEVVDFIKKVGETGLVRVGTSRTRGMGKVHLRVEKPTDESDRFQQFKGRLARFSRRLLERAQALSLPAGALPRFAFALTLHSPLILCDDLLRYRGVIDEEALMALLRLPSDAVPATSFHLLYSAAETRRVSGWHDLWGTPRTNEVAIDTGSVFLFTSDIDPEEAKPADALWHALFQVEEEGAGRRRAEGFGHIVVSDSFHLEEALP